MARRRVSAQSQSGAMAGETSTAAITRHQFWRISQATSCVPESPAYRVLSKSKTTSRGPQQPTADESPFSELGRRCRRGEHCHFVRDKS